MAKTVPDVAVQVSIPRAFWWANKDTASFWDDNIDRFAWESDLAKGRMDVLCMERIFPVPQPLRNLLIQKYCRPEDRETAKANPKNKHCLVRPMLGRSAHRMSSLPLNLRNFPMTVDRFEELGLPAEEYTTAMADAMAVLHWNAKLDGLDIEFVLGSSPTLEQEVRRPLTYEDIKSLPQGASTFEMVTNPAAVFKKRIMSLWMIDFDSCSAITVDAAGVKKAVKTFMETYAYCPRPSKGGTFRQNLWVRFGRRYIDTSQKFLSGRDKDLPKDFLEGVTSNVNANRARERTDSAP